MSKNEGLVERATPSIATSCPWYRNVLETSVYRRGPWSSLEGTCLAGKKKIMEIKENSSASCPHRATSRSLWILRFFTLQLHPHLFLFSSLGGPLRIVTKEFNRGHPDLREFMAQSFRHLYIPREEIFVKNTTSLRTIARSIAGLFAFISFAIMSWPGRFKVCNCALTDMEQRTFMWVTVVNHIHAIYILFTLVMLAHADPIHASSFSSLIDRRTIESKQRKARLPCTHKACIYVCTSYSTGNWRESLIHTKTLSSHEDLKILLLFNLSKNVTFIVSQNQRNVM